jgi:putative transcriptional regulator
MTAVRRLLFTLSTSLWLSSTAFVLQQPMHALTALGMSKNSDRAYIERNLEDAMNNDWRLFRANLVAREKAEKEGGQEFMSNDYYHHHEEEEHDMHDHDMMYDDDMHDHNMHPQSIVEHEVTRNGQLGDLFAGAIQNIFNYSPNKGAEQYSTNDRHHSDEQMFLGEGIGSSPDPFASVEELPLWYESRDPKISKHRWAHGISHLEPGCVLIANEKLGGVFHQTIVLIIEHHEATGTFGVVINR